MTFPFLRPTDDPFVLQVRAFAIRFCAVIVGLNLFLRVFRKFGTWDIPEGWPISEGRFQLPTLEGLLFLIPAIILVWYCYKHRDQVFHSFKWVLVFSITLLVLSNGFHGINKGYVHTLTAAPGESPQEYYEDIGHVKSTTDFIGNYTSIQPSLLVHSRSHPPGPVLLMKWASDLLHGPIQISIVLGCACLLVMGLAFRSILSNLGIESAQINFVTLLFLCCTQVQVYSIFCVDAVITALGCSLIAFVMLPRRIPSVILSGIALWCTLFFSFGSVFFVPPLFFWLWRKGRFVDGLLICGITGLGLFGLNQVLGYSWWESFRIASRIESPNGFELLHDPITYIATRFEDSFEPVLFIGPMFFMMIRQVLVQQLGKDASEKSLGGQLMVVGIGTLLAIFLTGAYRTGETARACLFIVPFFFIGVAPEIVKLAKSPDNRATMLRWALIYTMLLQALMYYFW